MKNNHLIRTYHELIQLPTFEERFAYLKLDGQVGKDTFGFDRILNQKFYRSPEWKSIRNEIIVRDCGCDLAMPEHEIYGPIIIHHMNPITIDDLSNATEYLLNPDYLITTMLSTHNAIHYGDFSHINKAPIERTPNDTCPWRH